MSESGLKINEDYFPPSPKEGYSVISSHTISYTLDELSTETTALVETFLPHMHTVLVPKAEIIGEKKSVIVIFTLVILIGKKSLSSEQPTGFALHRTMKDITDLRVKLEKAEGHCAPSDTHAANNTQGCLAIAGERLAGKNTSP